MADTLLRSLADFASDAFRDGIPGAVRDDITGRVLDVVGNSLAALGNHPYLAVSRVAFSWGGHPEASVFGEPASRFPAPSVSLINGTLAHSLDFDDTHLPSVLHPSASVIPAVLAIAEAMSCSGEEAIRAAALGDEICVRLGMASYDQTLGNSILFENGLHATSICGTIAVAASAGVLLGLDSSGVGHAMGIAASMGAGILEGNRTGGSVKGIHCGWAAHAGISAARLAQEGITAPPTVFEGRFGFFRAYSEGRYDERALIGELGTRWEMLRTHFKPYPTNHFTHPAIDAALALRDRGVAASEIVSMELGVAGPTLRTIAEPADLKARPPTPYAAKFSAAYTVASALVGGGGLGVSHDDFTEEALHNPERQRLAEVLTCHEDPEATRRFPHAFLCVLKAVTRDGSVIEERVRANRGGPERPLTKEELMTKFLVNAQLHLGAERANDLARSVWALPNADDVRTVLLLSGRDEL